MKPYTEEDSLMQTFVPEKTFIKCAQALDYRRLGKQRVECKQILNALKDGGAWSNHPATKMWKGYEPALRQYMRAVIVEWINRGYKNNMPIPRFYKSPILPPWWGGKIHQTHRAALLHKDEDFYGQFNWDEKPELNYFWPV